MVRVRLLPVLISAFLFTACEPGPAEPGEIPLVYGIEHTGEDCPSPPLPVYDALPMVRPLTDPFLASDGRGRSTDFSDWRCRRAEIADEIQHYEIGEKPARPDSITASYEEDTLRVNVTVNGNTLTLTSAITIPEGEGPFPAVIGMWRPSGSLPADIFEERNVMQIPFNFGEVMSHTQTRGEEPLNALYPELTYMGSYSAWPWGVSRLIDGLELVADSLKLDTSRMAVTGCSFAGKMALYSGAFDERIALTIAQESGGGGAAAWRVSETLGNVETLGNTNFAWFLEDLRRFSNAVPKLPFDHHELMALVAPRALLVLGNTDYEWLADESGYVSSRAAHEVWKTFDIADRFGFAIAGGHRHCALPDFERPYVEAFVDKFLLGDTTAVTDVQAHPFDDVDYERWYEWWGTEDPAFTDVVIDPAGSETVYVEAECAARGSDWELHEDAEASNGAYVAIAAGLNSTEAAPTELEGLMTVPFSVSQDTTYYVFARLNSPSADDDSIWFKMNNGDFEVANGLATVGWQWVEVTKADLAPGDHELTIAYREDGVLIDTISITSFAYGPDELGEVVATEGCQGVAD